MWITDLFDYPDGQGSLLGEQGTVIINGTTSITFSGQSSDQGNGEQLVNFGQAYSVTSLKFVFNTYPFPGGTNNEFSVAGFTGALSEPTTMLLLAFGVLGLAGIKRKFEL